MPFVFYSLIVALDAKESEKGDDERRVSAKKSSSSVGEGKKRRYKVFAREIKTGDDAPNECDEEDNLGGNKESKHKSLADEQQQKEGKSDINVESSAIQLPVLDKSPEKVAK